MKPEQRRQKAREMLEEIKDCPSTDKPERIEKLIDEEFKTLYNIAAIRRLGEAIISADDDTLTATNNMDIDEVFNLFVFYQ